MFLNLKSQFPEFSRFPCYLEFRFYTQPKAPAWVRLSGTAAEDPPAPSFCCRNLLRRSLAKRKKSAPRRTIWKPLTAAAVIVLLLASVFGYRALDKNVCTVTDDINPSITLTVNRLGRVKSMDAGNADAAALLAGTDLQRERTQDALGILTDALTDADYLTCADNTLLVTVEGASAARAQELGQAVYDAAQASARSGRDV